MSVSIDSDEREFIDNISWDTDSDDEDFELDNLVIEETEKNKLAKEDSDDGDIGLLADYNQAYHCFNRTYMKPSPYERNDVKEILQEASRSKSQYQKRPNESEDKEKENDLYKFELEEMRSYLQHENDYETYLHHKSQAEKSAQEKQRESRIELQ